VRFRNHDDSGPGGADHDPGDEDDPVDFEAWLAAWKADCHAILGRLRRIADGAQR